MSVLPSVLTTTALLGISPAYGMSPEYGIGSRSGPRPASSAAQPTYNTRYSAVAASSTYATRSAHSVRPATAPPATHVHAAGHGAYASCFPSAVAHRPTATTGSPHRGGQKASALAAHSAVAGHETSAATAHATVVGHKAALANAHAAPERGKAVRATAHAAHAEHKAISATAHSAPTEHKAAAPAPRAATSLAHRTSTSATGRSLAAKAPAASIRMAVFDFKASRAPAGAPAARRSTAPALAASAVSSPDPSRAGSLPGVGRLRPGRTDSSPEDQGDEPTYTDEDPSALQEPTENDTQYPDLGDEESIGAVDPLKSSPTPSQDSAVLAREAGGSEPVTEILPLGSGLVLVGAGLGLALLALRLRRE
ncbi:hypothetical protein [Streptomyces sp. CA-106110]|uniref:hypothetical protein n=2 Tax=unclassified Streptomyces TaxID=2593676 RepID=UPI003D93E8D5